MKQLINDMGALNQIVPYQVQHLGYNIYQFQSKLGATYYLRLRNGVYLGNNDCHHLSFYIDKNSLSVRSFLDGNVERTVVAILKQFFAENPKDCLLFSSEGSKGRDALKSSFYYHWFKWYQQIDGSLDVTYIHRMVKIEDVEIPFNIMFRNDHPEEKLICKTFEEDTLAIAKAMYEE